MNCPSCNAPKLRTVETFQWDDGTARTKKCDACGRRFISVEQIQEGAFIPNVVRNAKRRPKPEGV